MSTKQIYLLDPYNEVIKITANQDSVFRFDINNSLIYTRQEIFDKIATVEYMNGNEDNVSRVLRWCCSFMNNNEDLHDARINNMNLIEWNNSYSDQVCGGIAAILWDIYRQYYPNNAFTASGPGHAYNEVNGYTVDQINKIPCYDGKYTGASFAEILAEKPLHKEPLRVIDWDIQVKAEASYALYTQGNVDAYNTNVASISTIDNVYVKMPAGSNIVLPVQSTNRPKTEVGNNVLMWANGIMTIPSGIMGIVEMPFRLMNVTGTGTIILDGITYNLPNDEASLLAYCQTTKHTSEKWLSGFEILANTGGLVAEFLVNHYRMLLFHKNLIDYTIISGSVTFSRVKTTIPVPTITLNIEKNDSGGWTLDYNNIFLKDKSFKIPVHGIGLFTRVIWFLPNNDGKFCPPKIYGNAAANTLSSISADIAVIDKCFSSRLMPISESFTGSLELSFTSIDGSDTYYTLDGSTPDATKILYTGQFTISITTTVKWINIKTNYANSHVNSRVITKL